MTDASSTQRLYAYPAEIMTVDDGAIVSRGLVQLHVAGEHVAHVLELIFLLASGDGYPRDGILAKVRSVFSALDESAIVRLIDVLASRRFLSASDTSEAPADETPFDVFYWNFGAPGEAVRRVTSATAVAVVGINDISRRLVSALPEAGFSDVTFIDAPMLRNAALFDAAGAVDRKHWTGGDPVGFDNWAEEVEAVGTACVIATCDSGDQSALLPVNALALERGLRLLPVSLTDHVGWVGPLVIPGDTPCLECLRARQNANMGDPDRTRQIERQRRPGRAGLSYHPSMAAILADFAIAQLSKSVIPALPDRMAGQVIEVDLLTPSAISRRVLRIPRCQACGYLSRSSAINLDKREFMHEKVG